jgi:uncharacterized protein
VRGIGAFLLLAFVLAWVPVFIVLAQGVTPDHLLSFQVALLPMALAPAVAACIVRLWITREGFQDGGFALNLRAQGPRYALAALLPYGVVASIMALSWVLGTGAPDFSLQTAGVAMAAQLHQPAPPVLRYQLFIVAPQLLLSAILATPVLLGEELGWRGYLQRRLDPERPLRAAVLTGLIWGIWHYPLVLAGYEYPGYPLTGLATFPVFTVLLSIVFGWLRERTGSIWAPSLAHAATNAVGGSLTLLAFWGTPHSILVRYCGVYGFLPLGAVCAALYLTGRLTPRTAAPTGQIPTAGDGCP